MSRRLLVTGASGFIARALLTSKLREYEYVAAARNPVHFEQASWTQSPDLSGSADWKDALQGIDCVVHLAGRAHLGRNSPAAAYMIENAQGAIKLAQDAALAGVRHFIFLSSAKVLGDESGATPLAESAPARPGDFYAASKLAAENGLRELGGSMRVTILRPPLVYGPGVKANFLALLSAVARGIPLPLASIRNRRSLIGVDNLASAILACVQSTGSQSRTFNVTDGVPLSTPDLVRSIESALGKPSRLFGFPPKLLEACGAAIRRAETIKRLTRSLELDDRAIRTELGWENVRTFNDGIVETANWYDSLYGGD